jgi:phospholipid/cholesterol/gamma-HCH transport system permease protein
LAARARVTAESSVSREGPAVLVRLSGPVRLRDGLVSAGSVARALEAQPTPAQVRVDASGVGEWDTALVVFLAHVYDACAARQVDLDTTDVPQAARRMLEMARQGAVIGGIHPDEFEDVRLGEQFATWARGWARLTASAVGLPVGARAARPEPLVDGVGRWGMQWGERIDDRVVFLGASAIAVVRMLLGRTRRLRARFFLFLQQAGVETLPIVAVMGFAIGVVLALIAVGQLQKFGVTPLVARLVSITVLREMGSLMVGIAIAGRLGSAIAAEIATMVARDETDALRIIGVDRFEYLVAPRVVATGLAGVFLVVYANAFGLFGGFFAGVGLSGLPAGEYLDRMRGVLGYKHMLSGLIKGFAFGTVTALAACYHGLRSGRSAGAVGLTVRRAVVGAVVGVVLADVAITLVFKWVKL